MSCVLCELVPRRQFVFNLEVPTAVRVDNLTKDALQIPPSALIRVIEQRSVFSI